MQKKPPLILTLRIESKSQAFFDAQRQIYFPPKRNFLSAHLTLFHQLPDEEDTHRYLVSLQFHSFPIQITGLQNLGSGIAYKAESAQLQALHHQIRDYFLAKLIPQDQQPFRPHITIMNKSTPEKVQALLTDLTSGFKPFSITAIGVDLWTYLGGPWHFERTISFHSQPY